MVGLCEIKNPMNPQGAVVFCQICQANSELNTSVGGVSHQTQPGDPSHGAFGGLRYESHPHHPPTMVNMRLEGPIRTPKWRDSPLNHVFWYVLVLYLFGSQSINYIGDWQGHDPQSLISAEWESFWTTISSKWGWIKSYHHILGGWTSWWTSINPRILDPYAIALRVARPLERRVAWLEEDQKPFDLGIKWRWEDRNG